MATLKLGGNNYAWHYIERIANDQEPLDIAGFLKLVIEALNAVGVEYLISGAIAEWAWGEPRHARGLLCIPGWFSDAAGVVIGSPQERVTRYRITLVGIQHSCYDRNSTCSQTPTSV